MARFENPRQLNRSKSPPKAEIVTVGAELLNGSAINTNARYLGRELKALGFEVFRQTSCDDRSRDIQETLRRALSEVDVVVMSGGLGPTPDDVTRESIAELFHAPLILSQRQYREIQRYYHKKGRRVPRIVRQEALFPEGSTPLFNRYGIALGFILKSENGILIVLPGVPREMVKLFENHVRPVLRRKFGVLHRPYTLVVKTLGLSEPEIMSRLGSSFLKLGDFQFGIYPDVGEVVIRVYAHSKGLIQRLRRHMTRALRAAVYSLSDATLEEVVGKKLLERNWTLSVAESCTGGQLSQTFTSIPGASVYFEGGVMAYQDQVKFSLLGVSKAVLKKAGAVSKEAASSMARGVRRLLKTTLGVAVTGIAGPSGGSPRKPVGLVYLAIASDKACRVWEEYFRGGREEIRLRATRKALALLWRWLKK